MTTQPEREKPITPKPPKPITPERPDPVRTRAMTVPDDGPSIPGRVFYLWTLERTRHAQVPALPAAAAVTEPFDTCGEWKAEEGDQNEGMDDAYTYKDEGGA